MPSIVDIYLNHVRQSISLYGQRTLVLLECGSFYEIYDVVPTENSSHLQCCRDILGILVTRKNKADSKSAYMAGIPTQSIRRYFKILIQHNYTVVVIGQKGTPPNITRDITQVISPGCNLSEEVHESTDTGQSVLAALLFEDSPAADGDCYAFLATFDTNLGSSHLETISIDTTSGNATHVINDLCTSLHETLQTHVFHELCVYHQRVKSSAHYERMGKAVKEFVGQWQSAGKLVHYTVDTTKLAHVFSPTFQRDFLERVFPQFKSAFCSIEESLGLQCVDRPMIATLVLLLQWIKQHDQRLVYDLARPTSHQGLIRGVIEPMTIANSEIEVVHENDTFSAKKIFDSVRCYNELYAKLDIFDPKGHDAVEHEECHIKVHNKDSEPVIRNHRSLFGHLNRCQTKMGTRLLRERLVRLSTDVEELQSRYSLVEGIQNDEETKQMFKTYLRSPDLKRMYRRFGLGNLQPHDMPRVMQAQNDLREVIRHLTSLPKAHILSELLMSKRVYRKLFENLDAYQQELMSIFNMEACMHTSFASGNITESLFQKGVSENVDKVVNHYIQSSNTLKTLAQALESWVPDMSSSFGAGSAWIHVKQNDKDGYWLELSRTRYLKLKHALDTKRNENLAVFHQQTQGLWSIEELVFDTSRKTNVKISGPRIRTHSQTLQTAQQTLTKVVKEEYVRQLHRLYKAFYDSTVEPLMSIVAQVDVAYTTARIATQYGYVKPELIEATSSFVDATALRHPLIERLLAVSKKTEYVPNDVCLSNEACYLLHGVNSVGKSSLLKSIAMGVLMAQAGLYVASASFRFAPYTKLFARTGNDDNLHRHHSSFVKEMSETKQIVDHADAQSLIIADELCASTELDSAVRIVSTLLTLLCSRKASYMFATHLFALQDDPRVQQMLSSQVLKNIHLHVDFRNEQLVFERTIRPGLPTNRTYGVLVADKVIAHPEFTALMEAGDSTLGELVTHDTPLVHSSKYNHKVWVDSCEVCGYKPQTKLHTPLEVHHIQEQQTANAKNGLIKGRFHKNERHNLAVLCKPCHQSIDTGDLVVLGHTSTLSGESLVYYHPKKNHLPQNDMNSSVDSSPESTSKSKYSSSQTATIRNYALQNKTPGQTKTQWWRTTRVATEIPIGYKKFCEVVKE